MKEILIQALGVFRNYGGRAYWQVYNVYLTAWQVYMYI